MNHKKISFIKSGIRISVGILFVVAEVLGILEEVFDKREEI